MTTSMDPSTHVETVATEAVDADVIVVGAGPAGLLAAIESADAGLRVLLLESEDEVGGSGALAAGQIVFCETDLEPAGRELLYEDLCRAHKFDHVPELSRLYVDQAGQAYRRMTGLGVHYVRSIAMTHMSANWVHEVSMDRPGGAEVVRILAGVCREKGIDIRVATRMVRLLTDPSGRVNGVRVHRDGAEVDLVGAGAVILTCGGFTRNPELISTFGLASASHIFPLTAPGCRGDGLRAAMALGAGTAHLAKGIKPSAPAEPTTGRGTLIFYTGGIIVNARGERFIAESSVYTDISTLGLEQPGGVMVHIYDAECKRLFGETMWATIEQLNGYQELSSPSLSGLCDLIAEKTDFDTDRAIRTVEAYNAAHSGDGQDDVGRVHLMGTSGEPFPLQSAPYFAVITVPGTTHFNGGLAVDESLQVHDVFGAPIPGLYAAGEIVGGFHGDGYMSGSQWGQAVVFGMCAGISASREVLQVREGGVE